MDGLSIKEVGIDVSKFDLAEVLEHIKKLNVLKKALEAADTFREQSVKYAKLEAAAK